jgi:lactate 2-monooxygenase
MNQFGDYQNEIYFDGLRGIRPSLPVDFKRLEERASAALPQSVLTYVQGGCGDESTQRRNVEAFGEWGLVPRMLVDTRVRDLSVTVFGKRYPSP